MAIIYYADQDVKGNITLGGNLIFDTGGNAFITTSGGDLTLQTSTDDIFLIAQDDISLAVNGGDVGVYISGGGGTSLRYNNSQKLITTNSGVNIGFPTSAGGVLNTAGQLYIEHQGTAWDETTPGTARGAIHMDPVGSGADDTGNAITFGASDHSGGTVSDAGIYVRSDGNYGTKMYIATTDSYSLGSKTAITILQTGAVVINRSHLVIGTIANSSSDTDKFLVSNNGQVQYRTGAQVLSDIGGIAGSGTTNFIPMFTPNGTSLGNSQISQANIGTGNAKRITVTSARMTITGNGGDADGGTLNLSSNSARLGIATNSITGGEPEASLDVGKNARVRGSLNVGLTTEQYLFVSTTGDQPVGNVKMGYYGDGVDYALSGDNTTSCQYTTAFSNGGRLCEDERIMTFKLTRSQIAGLLATQKTLIAADSNFNYIVKEAYMYQVNTSPGQAPSFNTGNIVIQYQSSTGGTTRIDDAFTLSSTLLNATRSNRKVLFFKQEECAQVGSQYAVPRAAVVLKATSSPSNVGSGTVDYYLRLRVKNIDLNDDIVNNAQLITIT